MGLIKSVTRYLFIAELQESIKIPPVSLFSLLLSYSLLCLCLYFADTKAAASSASQPAEEKTKKPSLEKEK